MTESSSRSTRPGLGASLGALFGGAAAQAQRNALKLTLVALEHLLRQQQWARDRLKAHAGANLRFGIDGPPLAGLPPPEWRVTIDEQGFLREAPADAAPSASLLLRPSVDALFATLREGPDGLSRHLRIEGDVMLAATMGELAKYLRWEPEEDLSRIVGDAAAHRIASTAREGGERLRDLGERAASAASGFVAGDQQQLATRPLAAWLRDGTVALESRVSALEARVQRLRQAA
jgi:ubiquinone biosynthesis protein UbiJ